MTEASDAQKAAEAEPAETRRRPVANHRTLVAAIDAFVDQTAGVHDLIAVVGPHAEELDERPRTVRSVVAALPSTLISAQRDTVAEALANFVSHGDDSEVHGKAWEELVRTVEGVCDSSAQAAYVLHEVGRRLSSRSRRSSQFYSAALVALTTYFEALLAAVFAEYYRHFPNAMGSDAKEFSLDDLKKLASIDEAQEAAIDSRVVDLMRQGLGGWRPWFQRLFKTDFADLVPLHDGFREVVERRNAHVHHGGRVSQQYLRNVSFKTDPPALGTRLDCGPKYLSHATDIVTAVGLTLAVGCLFKQDKNEKRVAGYASGLVYDLLYAERWTAVRLVSPRLRDWAQPEESRLILQVNEWIARKQLDNDGWRDEVAAWDTSVLHGRYRLGKASLLDDLDDVFAQLDRLLVARELSVADLEHWPLLQKARESERFTDLLAKHVTSGDPALEQHEDGYVDDARSHGEIGEDDPPASGVVVDA